MHGAVELHRDRAAGELRVRAARQRLHLGAQLARPPHVVVIAERDQVLLQRADPGVARPGQPWCSLVDQHGHAAVRLEIRLGPVVDHHHSQAARIVLR
jgi:hypothetical protein